MGLAKASQMEERDAHPRTRFEAGEGKKPPSSSALDQVPSRSGGGLQACADQANILAGVKSLMKAEKTKLALSTAGIVVCSIVAGALKKSLLVDATYGPEKHTFPPYADFMTFVNSVGVCVIALSHYGLRRKAVYPAGPLIVYFGIACCTTLAMVSDSQIDQRFSVGLSATLKSLSVLAVMAWQWSVLRAKYGGKDWGLALLFTLACIAAFVPWSHSEEQTRGYKVQLEGLFWSAGATVLFVLFFIGSDSLSQSYQDKLYLDFSMPVSEQVLFIYTFVGIMNLIGWLVGKHLGAIAGFVVDHPVVIASLAVCALPVVAKVYLMSYMLRLCGALICVMIHQVMMALMAVVDAGPLLTRDTPFCWLGTLLMVCILLYVMVSMPHHQHGVIPSEKELQEEGPWRQKEDTKGDEERSLLGAGTGRSKEGNDGALDLEAK